LQFHGFEVDYLREFPRGLREGELPWNILRYDLDEKIENIEKKVLKKIDKEFISKVHFPTIDHN